MIPNAHVLITIIILKLWATQLAPCAAPIAVLRDDSHGQIVVLDRVVDATYGVFLVGPQEEELIVPLGGACAVVLSRRSTISFGSLRELYDRIDQKQHILRQRGQTIPVTE